MSLGSEDCWTGEGGLVVSGVSGGILSFKLTTNSFLRVWGRVSLCLLTAGERAEPLSLRVSHLCSCDMLGVPSYRPVQ